MALDSLSGQRSNDQDRFGLVAFIVAVVLSIVLVSAWARDDGSGPLRSMQDGFRSVIAPVTEFGTFATSPGRGASQAAQNALASDETLIDLKNENAQLRADNARLAEYEAESARLAALLGIRDAYNLETIGARVIGSTTDVYYRTITIDRGTRDGLTEGMVVMSANGLVGQIISAGGSTSVVRLITDTQSGVAVMIQQSRATGVVSGSTDGRLHLEYVSRDVAVDVGDVVITSGLGGIYPKGIIVGTVVSVTGSETDTYHTIIVEPIERVAAFEEVLVIIDDADEVATPSAADLQAAATAGADAAGTDTTGTETGDAAATDTDEAAAQDEQGGEGQ